MTKSIVGETKLEKLLQAMSPQLLGEDYIFCTIPQARYGDHAELEPIAAFKEQEGLTLVIPKSQADRKGIGYESVFKCITLNVHSSLDAVGLTAAFSRKLTDHGISANVIAGYYHDHIFVQKQLADQAVKALHEFGQS